MTTETDTFSGSHIIEELRAEVELLEELVRRSRVMLRRMDALIASHRNHLDEESIFDSGSHAGDGMLGTLQ